MHESVTVTDSAGVRVVTTTALEWEGVRVPARQVVLRVPDSSTSGAAPIGMIGDAVILPDGRVAVLDRLAQVVVVYDSTGTEAYRVGRKGQGPGEFTAAVSLQEMDSGALEVYDRSLGRLSEVLPDGRIGEVVTLTEPHFARPPHLAWRLDETRILAWEFDLNNRRVEARSRGAERVVMPGTLRVVDLLGGEADTVFLAPALEMVFEAGRMWFPPFGPVAAIQLAGGQVHFTTAATHEISVYSADGSATAAYRLPTEDRPLDRRVLQDLENEARMAAVAEGVEFFAGAMFDPRLQPDLMPAFERLTVAPSGAIWAKRHEPFRRPESEWWVLAGDGRFRGLVELPDGTTLLSLTSERMLLRVLDTLDVPSLEVWTIPPYLR